MASQPWLRLYREVIHDPKLMRVSPAGRWLWITILCLANDDGELLAAPGEPMMMHEIVSVAGLLAADEAAAIIEWFCRAGMLEDCDGTFRLQKWGVRQYRQDSSTARTRKYRERIKTEEQIHTTETESKRHSDATVTLSCDVCGDVGNHKPHECPVNYVFQNWKNSVEWIATNMGKKTAAPKTLSGPRVKAIKRALDDYGFTEINKQIQAIRESPFLLGDNDRGWQITLDWFLKPANLLKVVEGNYVKTAKKNNEQHVGGGLEDFQWDTEDYQKYGGDERWDAYWDAHDGLPGPWPRFKVWFDATV